MRKLFDIHDRVVAIAGGAGAFGSAIATELASRGCRISLLDIDAVGLKRVVSHMPSGSAVHYQVFDATDEGDCEAVFESCVSRWGRLDALVNCVGVFEVMPVVEMEKATFARVLETNVSAAFSMNRIAARHMMPNEYGRIINIASVSDAVANPGYAAYAASKSALTHLTRVLAVECAPYSITVNAISPAMCETSLTEKFLAQNTHREDAKSRILLQRLLQPEDLLGTVVLLLSPSGEFITGQAIYVDGGRTIS